jgi:hypothetical protein
MSAQVTILQLPAAGAITGAEAVPIVQNGVTVQTTTAALAGSPVQTYTYLTVNQTPQLANSRYVGATNGLTVTDGGAQGVFNITTTGALSSLVSSGTGIQVKTSSTAITGRSVAASGNGLSVTNGSGVSGDPTVALSGQTLNFANASFNGLVVLSTAGAITSATITGTANQIGVANGTGVGGNPTISLATDPVIPGTGGVVVPAGTTGQRGSSTLGNIRYNSTTGLFEGYNGAWTAFASNSGVTSIATGTGLTGGPITSTGTISIDVTGVSAATYGSSSVVPVIAVNAQGQITSATNTTINAVTLTTGTISTTPSNSTDIANKAYVDTVAQGLDTKASVVAGTTANITLSGAQTIDGIAVVATDRVLVKNQTAPADNGIYIASATAWSRAPDMDTWAEVPGAYVFVETGSTLADTGWVCTSNAGGTIGVTAITWAQFSGAGSGVSSITFGSTGLTPSTATTGAVTVAGTLALTNGGTGQTTASAAFNALSPITTTGDLIIGTGVNTASRLAIGANGYLLTSNGTTASWVAAPASGVTTFSAGTTGLTPSTATGGAVTLAGTLAVANGGTNITSYAVGDIIYASTTGVLSSLADIATGNALITGGVGVAPSYGKIGLTTHVSGTLPVANGGTGDTTYTNGQLLIGNTTGNTLTKATLTAGSGITITNGTGTITIATSGGGGTVTSVAQSFTGGIISVAGSPITTSGTLALTVAGTSGGVPYFTSTSTWATSALLAANALMVGGGAGVAPSTVTTGTGVVTALGVNTGTAGAFVVNGGALGTPSSGTVTNLTGTASININGTVGATTTNTGAFTTVAATTVTATTGIFGGTF